MSCVMGGDHTNLNTTPPPTPTNYAGQAAAVAVPITIPEDTAAGTYAIRATQGALSWCSQPVEVRA